MTYIINPWFFYFASLADNLQMLSIIVFSVSLIVAIIFGVVWCCEMNDYDCFGRDDKTQILNFFKKMFKTSTITVIVSATLMAIIPSEETINKMIISSVITKENIEGVKTDAKELVDYIVEKAAELKTKTSE